VRHSLAVAGVKQQIHRSKIFILDFKLVALLLTNLNWEEVIVSAPIVKLEAL
jgi:hypothetical protein